VGIIDARCNHEVELDFSYNDTYAIEELNDLWKTGCLYFFIIKRHIGA